MDIVVVKQEDGTYKSSPWYVKFGKFQGVLKRSEKVVNVAVNDEPVNCHMYLDATGTTEGRELWILCCYSASVAPWFAILGIEGVCVYVFCFPRLVIVDAIVVVQGIVVRAPFAVNCWIHFVKAAKPSAL